MGATPPVEKPAETERALLRGEIVKHGSSWAALQLCLGVRPVDLDELLRVAGVYDLTGKRRRVAFDACVDGYTVFHDARLRRKLSDAL